MLIQMAHEVHIRDLIHHYNSNFSNDIEHYPIFYRETRYGNMEYLVLGGIKFNNYSNTYIGYGCIGNNQYSQLLKWNRRFSLNTMDIRPFLIKEIDNLQSTIANDYFSAYYGLPAFTKMLEPISV